MTFAALRISLWTGFFIEHISTGEWQLASRLVRNPKANRRSAIKAKIQVRAPLIFHESAP
jgi:hypothetical protein